MRIGILYGEGFGGVLSWMFANKCDIEFILSDHRLIAKPCNINYLFLLWYPEIIPKEILDIPKIGTINTHPSLLPNQRGKHYNFWNIVEGTDFGVSLHFATEKIDDGDIIFQKRIDKDWTDTGKTLYTKAKKAMVLLLGESLPKILSGDYIRTPQNEGSFHYAKELEPASIIDLDKEYKARDLINLIRARTFPPHPACTFQEGDNTYEIRSGINKLEDK